MTRPLVLLTLAAALTPGYAAEKLDLDRVTPVPGDQPIPIQDFMRGRALFSPDLNPSGTHLAALVTDTKEQNAVVVVDLKTNEPEYFKIHTNDDLSAIRGVFWLNDRRVIAFGNGLYAKDVGTATSAYPLLRSTGASLVGIPRKDREHPLLWVGSGGEFGVNDIGVTRVNSALDLGLALKARGLDWWDESREINLRHTITTFPRIEGVIGAATYYSDKDGELAFAIAGNEGIEKFYRFENDHWVLCPIDLDAYYFKGAGNERNQIVVCPRARTGKPMPLQFMNAATGELGEILVQDKAYDATTATLYRDRVSGIIIGITMQRAGPHTIWFDENYKAVQKLVDASFPGLIAQIIGNNEAGNLFLVATFSDRQPTAYHWVDLANHKAGLVKHTEPWLDPKRMQPRSMMKYQTADGHSLDAYVTLPAGATKANPPPLVVIPPYEIWARLTWEYDALAQYLASRGYAVMRPNHRGSYGYYWMFQEEDRYDFIRMTDDINSATDTLIKSGLVDAKRVAIMGASFGAYFALQGIERRPELYRCAVTIDGFFDWSDLMGDMKYYQYQTDSYAYFRRKLGDPKVEKEKYRLISPLNFVAQAKAAVFVSHDKSDADLYRIQSRKLVAELARNNLPHDSYYAPEISVPKDRLAKQVEQSERIEAFLAKHLMAKP